MKLTIHTYQLQTRKVFTTSHGSSNYRRCLILELSHEGLSGYGEATEILYYGKNLERMIQLADEVFATKSDPNQLDINEEVLDHLRKIHPATVSEHDDGNGPVAWILLIPTTLELMNQFI